MLISPLGLQCIIQLVVTCVLCCVQFSVNSGIMVKSFCDALELMVTMKCAFVPHAVDVLLFMWKTIIKACV